MYCEGLGMRSDNSVHNYDFLLQYILVLSHQCQYSLASYQNDCYLLLCDDKLYSLCDYLYILI